jgi:hypothetical protein
LPTTHFKRGNKHLFSPRAPPPPPPNPLFPSVWSNANPSPAPTNLNLHWKKVSLIFLKILYSTVLGKMMEHFPNNMVKIYFFQGVGTCGF